jgi:DNA-binding response OmpR family regulator
LRLEDGVVSKTILVADDEERLVSLLRAYLQQEGFNVVTALDGRAALFAARESRPDLIILDLMMPELDGYDFIRAHRRERDTPIIVLTARVEETDRILGLELGADDYVTKPFSPRELVARVKAVLRRSGQEAPPAEVLRAADIILDRAGHTVTVSGAPVDLTPSEFDLLSTLMAAPGRAFSRMELLDRIQGTAYEGYERTVDVHIKNLRAKIEVDPRNPRYVETVYGIGYRFTPNCHMKEPVKVSIRSLTVKLIIAFLVVSLAGTVLLALWAGRTTSNAFTSFVDEQEQAELVSRLAGYYRLNNNWDGVEALLGAPATPGQGTGPGRGQGAGVALADASGEVVVPGGGNPRGSQLTANRWRKGRQSSLMARQWAS